MQLNTILQLRDIGEGNIYKKKRFCGFFYKIIFYSSSMPYNSVLDLPEYVANVYPNTVKLSEFLTSIMECFFVFLQ